MIVALVALFVALGRGAYAAVELPECGTTSPPASNSATGAAGERHLTSPRGGVDCRA